MSYTFTRIERILDGTGWSRKKVFDLATAAEEAGHLLVSYDIVEGEEYPDEMGPEDLYSIATICEDWQRVCFYLKNKTL